MSESFGLGCLYCSGYDVKCENYSPVPKDILNPHICSWYKVVANDLEKLAEDGKALITFESLREVVLNETVNVR